jgi:hypothetical protein
MKLTSSTVILPDETTELHKLLLFVFWVFDKKPPKFISCSKPKDQQFDTFASASKVPGNEDNTCIRTCASNDSGDLAEAVASLAPSEQEQKKKSALERPTTT